MVYFIGLSDILSRSPVFRSSTDVLCTPQALYDPHIPSLKKLLPLDVFPSPTLFSDPSLLVSLRTLGMNTSITVAGVLTAAHDIQESLDSITFKNNNIKNLNDRKAVASQVSVDGGSENVLAVESIEETVNRATGLLQYLEANIKSLLLEADPLGWEKVQKLQDDTENGSGDENSLLNNDTEQLLGGIWGSELRGITWIPVLTGAPRGQASMLPWPSRVHVSALAAPSQCVHMKDIISCSSTHRICSMDVKDEVLRLLLGWERPVPGRIASLQLLNMKEALDRCIDTDRNTDSLVQAYYQYIPSIMLGLSAALKRESDREIFIWLKILRDKSIIWINTCGKFVNSNKVAFNSPLSSINTEPYLFIVQGELLKFKPLLLELAVRENFEIHDFAVLTRDLCNQYIDAPLTPQGLAVCLAALQVVFVILFILQLLSFHLNLFCLVQRI
jgi:hypothetical protein